MERIGRPGDEFREKLSRNDIERICRRHGLATPREVVAEDRGNESVAYHLDGRAFLAFGITDDTRRKVEVLRVLEHIERMPAPRVIAWGESDPDLQVPYAITTACPGIRLDLLWERCTHVDRLRLLEAVGYGMGHYHTITFSDAKAAAKEVGLGHRVVNALQRGRADARRGFSEQKDALGGLAERLRRSLGVDARSITEALKALYARDLPSAETPFVEAGLIHDEPWAEHFFVEETEGSFALSGCVDLEEVAIADSIDETIKLYVSMLGLDVEYLAAFRRGYEQFFRFPPDAEERLRVAAVGYDLCSILWLLDTMEKRPEWGFARGWVAGHLRRLEGWLEESKRIDRALFRKDIGPW